MLTSYHNHTRWSDGACTLQEQLDGALAAGLDELGISDHFVLHPSGEAVEWTMPLDFLAEYVGHLQDARASTKNLSIRIGVEADYFPETVEKLRPILSSQPLDFVVGSVHYVDDFPLDEHTRYWDALSTEEVDEMWRKYWVRIRQMAESRVYDFVGHIDLPKKFGHRPVADMTLWVEQALDAMKAADMAIEINTAGWSLPAQEGYPSLGILTAARRREIPLLINADAHSPKHLVRNFDLARELAHGAGYTELVRYDNRERYPYPL